MRTGQKAFKMSTHKKRVNWILKNMRREQIKYNLSKGRLSEEIRLIFLAMKYNKLYAKTTYWKDCSTGIVLALREANEKWNTF